MFERPRRALSLSGVRRTKVGAEASLAGPLSAQLAFYGRNQLSSRRRISRDTARAAALRLIKKSKNMTKPPKAHGG